MATREYLICHGFKTTVPGQVLHLADRPDRQAEVRRQDFRVDSSKSVRPHPRLRHLHHNSHKHSRRKVTSASLQLTREPSSDAYFNSRISGYVGIRSGFSQSLSAGNQLQALDGSGTDGSITALTWITCSLSSATSRSFQK